MIENLKPNLTRRRIRGFLIAGLGIGLLALAVVGMNQSLRHDSFLTGYVLMAAFVVLTLFGVRKRLSFLPAIGSAKLWMQVHAYVGLATFAMFGLHIGWQFPNGIFERMLAILFLVVGGSGLYGLAITRLYPKRLASLGGEVIYETIPLQRTQIASDARLLVLESSRTSDVLGRFYVNHLASFLEQPRGLGYWLLPNGRRKRQLVTEIKDLDRYLNEEHRGVGRQLTDIVERRDRLDYHEALQSRLKLWLFIHIGFTYSLLMLSLFHMVLAHAYSGGLG